MKEKEKQHKCDSCGKSFSREGYLKQHIYRVHEDYECEACGKIFSVAESSSRGKSFSLLGYLKKHIKVIHKGHKDY